ncbi:PH domain-containing protein [Nocardioides sp. AE5]|uniref:PH domain-containing protein n=1 Tax=Nocardioides sp. AE5 TaxID=2962573 RepID=UPI002881EF28|nr:PH domain-containing protein [Nocardioides sp. AE5]MDT0202148.1 PH domain-containing protein [Nocardioides sp. AE5]
MNQWQRLDAKVMLVGPVGAFKQFLLPALIALIGVGTQQPKWLLLAAPLIIVASIVIGVVPWFTTRFQVTDTQLVVTTGLVSKQRLTAPLDRIRSVDLEATLLHRVLQLEKVQVGTGVDDTMIELNALSVSQAADLRRLLLSRRGTSAPDEAPAATGTQSSVGEASEPSGATAPVAEGTPVPAADLVTFSPTWARFAPFSLGRLAIALGGLGALFQFSSEIRIDLSDNDVWNRVASASLALVLLGVFAIALVLWTALSMVTYLIGWWQLRLFREDGNLRLTRGLFTTQSTTVEEARIRGVRLRETALLRTVDGAEIHALVTGLEDATYAVLPQAPRAVTHAVAVAILGDEEPVRVALVPHGPAALRRALLRNVVTAEVLLLPAVALPLWLEWGWWVPLAAAVALALFGLVLGRMEYRHLGHALTTDHLVAGSGITARTRTALQRTGIIGWVFSQNPFQRRRALATLTATTAAGAEQVVIRDVPLALAVALADRATPGMLAEFTA